MRNGIKRIYYLILLIILGLCASCGYHLKTAGEPLGIEIESIAIPLITSSSSTKGFEADFTRIIREEFISHSKVPVVRKEEAQMLVKGNIFEIRSDPLSFNLEQRTVAGKVVTYETTSSRRLKVKMDVSLIERISGKTIWRDNSLSEEASFDVGTDPLVNEYNQQQASLKIAGLIARRIYLKIMERF
jgi:hypothetical protein